MNYDERMNLISKEVAKLLSIYEPPRNLKTEEQKNLHLKMLIKSLNQSFPTDTTHDHIVGTFERASMSISSKKKTNTWPQNAEITKAVSSAMGGAYAQSKSLEDDLEAAATFLEAQGRAHPVYNSNFIAKKLIERGLLKDERDAHWRGFDMFEDKSTYTKQRMTLDEWKNHIRILAKNIWNCSIEEAEHRELFGEGAALGPVDPDALPEELLPRLRQAGM